MPTAALRRYAKNPILTGRDFPEGSGIKRVFKSGVIKTRGRYVMACRVEDAGLRNRIWIADSDDGYRFVPRSAAAELPIRTRSSPSTPRACTTTLASPSSTGRVT